MRRQLLSLLAAVLAILPSSAQTVTDRDWQDGKYSMFIHFGLYSELGGVWQGQKITRGYSEQIQSHAGLRADEYEEVADIFDPTLFDADAIVALAKKAGMRSIVITSKHHDGFCLWHTETTWYNAFDGTPAHRDFIAELSDACRRGGLRFGLYFSLIDWNYPGGSSMTTHNANLISDSHHQLNLAQVRELVSNYGQISEMWFDMGSLTPMQSKEIYDLVHSCQPSCMVGGRLGNGYYDFAVMSDNYYPEASLQTPWQSCASMFDETWGYRSWQERGSSHEKAQEKLRSLVSVVSGGGNYLLNIGPKGDGSVVPFEAEVLEEIGAWLKQNGNAIYGTEASPYRTPFSWGCVTRASNVMYVILSGKKPSSGEITLPFRENRFQKCEGPAKAKVKDGAVTLTLDKNAYDGGIKVIKLTFKKKIVPMETALQNTRITNSSYYCQDYYTNARSEVSYTWNVYSTKKLAGVCFSYTETDVDKVAEVRLDGNLYSYTLHKTAPRNISQGHISEGVRYVCQTHKSDFNAPMSKTFSPKEVPDRDPDASWGQTVLDHQTVESRPFRTVYVMENVNSACEQDAIIEVGAGNGVELYVNGQSVMKHLNPYRCTYRMEKVRVHLKAGENQLVLRAYNRFERSVEWHLKVSDDQTIYMSPLYMPEFRNGHSHTVNLRMAECDSPHKDCELYNLQMVF